MDFFFLGIRHERLMTEHRKTERQARKPSSSGKKSSGIRVRDKSPVSYSSRIQISERSPGFSASYSARVEVRERSPISRARCSQWSPPQNRRQLQMEREIQRAFYEKNPASIDSGFGIRKWREFTESFLEF